jgi:hypothetical protein
MDGQTSAPATKSASSAPKGQALAQESNKSVTNKVDKSKGKKEKSGKKKADLLHRIDAQLTKLKGGKQKKEKATEMAQEQEKDPYDGGEDTPTGDEKE